ncbi:MAG: YqgE/AlgH family protein [Bacteroidetes bacterium]|nr:YqgE/AlgH family protein [Bacteroidota bacterium]
MVKLDFTKFKPAQGKLLLSEPFMNDPNFKRTVVLLASHNEEGSVGFVLNRPMELKLGQIIEEFGDTSTPLSAGFFPVWDGGPVQRDALFYVHTLGDAIPGSIPVVGDLYWSGNFETVKALIKGNKISENEIRLFIGYSGWGAGQLQEEIKRNSWLIADATIDLVMNAGTSSDAKLWQDILKSMGKEYEIISNFPENPMWN